VAAFAEVAEEPSSKFGSYEGEMLNGDLTNLLADRHFDRLVSEDRCHSTFVVNIEVIEVGHHLDHYPAAVSWYYQGQKAYKNEQVVMGLEAYVMIAPDVVAAAAA
jgi:hypothetical protein